MNNFKRLTIGTLTLSGALLLAACSSPAEEPIIDERAETEMPAETKIETDEQNTEGRQVQAGQGLEHLALEVTLDDAIDVFFDTFGSEEINIESVELEKENGRYEYEIEGWDANYDYELTLDAETSEIVEQEKEKDDDQDDIIDIESVISPLEAMEAALEASGSGYVEEWELEVENSRTIYDIEIADGNDQKVDALTGEVL